MTEERFCAAVAGGTLHGSVWNQQRPGVAVLGLNGITANHRSFRGLAELVDVPLYSVDQRGRGHSRALPAPFTLRQHADDAARVLDAAGRERAVVVGHSMGAFVATELAAHHPDRVAGVVLVDGGLPLRPAPADAEPEALLGPAIQRLTMTFPHRTAYREFWREHPAFGPYWSDLVEDYVDYDLQEIDGALRASASVEAVLANLVELDGSRGYHATVRAVEAAGVPRILLTSPRGLFDETPGLYDPEWLALQRAALPGLVVREVPGTNHYTILLGSGAAAVADAVRTVTPAEQVVGTEKEG